MDRGTGPINNAPLPAAAGGNATNPRPQHVAHECQPAEPTDLCQLDDTPGPPSPRRCAERHPPKCIPPVAAQHRHPAGCPLACRRNCCWATPRRSCASVKRTGVAALKQGFDQRQRNVLVEWIRSPRNLNEHKLIAHDFEELPNTTSDKGCSWSCALLASWSSHNNSFVRPCKQRTYLCHRKACKQQESAPRKESGEFAGPRATTMTTMSGGAGATASDGRLDCTGFQSLSIHMHTYMGMAMESVPEQQTPHTRSRTATTHDSQHHHAMRTTCVNLESRSRRQIEDKQYHT